MDVVRSKFGSVSWVENVKGIKDILKSLAVIHSNVVIESFYV